MEHVLRLYRTSACYPPNLPQLQRPGVRSGGAESEPCDRYQTAIEKRLAPERIKGQMLILLQCRDREAYFRDTYASYCPPALKLKAE
jgi:hypothetical protein